MRIISLCLFALLLVAAPPARAADWIRFVSLSVYYVEADTVRTADGLRHATGFLVAYYFRDSTLEAPTVERVEWVYDCAGNRRRVGERWVAGIAGDEVQQFLCTGRGGVRLSGAPTIRDSAIAYCARNSWSTVCTGEDEEDY